MRGLKLAALIMIALIVAGLSYSIIPSFKKGGKQPAEGSGADSKAGDNPKGVIVVLHAGSLTSPLEEVKREYERRNPNVEIRLEASGSAEAIRKVTELKKRADIVMSADHHLIEMMIPDHASWYVIFASNQLVLAYGRGSRYSGEVNGSNWYEILMRKDVRIGISDPNKDPCGYRALMSILLAEKLYRVPLSSILTEGTNVRVRGTEAWVPDPIEGSERVFIRPKSVELLSLLEAGIIDYAFEYRSVAVQHGLSYVELPKEISLSSPELEDLYSLAVVHLNAGRDEAVVRGSAIAYALTVPKVSENEGAAIDFLRFLLTEGLRIFEEKGQPPLRPPLGFGEVPAKLKDLVEVRG